MNRHIIPLVLTAIASLFSCDANYLATSQESQIVVEGWIENDACPVVIISETVPILDDKEVYYKDLGKYIVIGAKVSISDGTDSVVLTGRYDKGYFPPFVYTTDKMKGVQGRKYFLTVDYAGYHVTAETMIPEQPVMRGYSVELISSRDTLFQIKMSFMDYPGEKRYYQFFTRVGNESKQYLASRLGSIDNSTISSCDSLPVYRGRSAIKSYTPYFRWCDTVSVKLAQVDSVAYDYWYQYSKSEDMSSNIFFCSSSNLPTNLEGGIGYWFGYGAVDTTIIIAENI